MLEGQNISFLRGELPLFFDLSFSLKRGKRMIIRGANGSGKSTFLRLLTGLIPSTSGILFWNGEMISKTNLYLYQQDFLYVGHKLCLHPEARVSDQLQLWKNMYKIPEKEIEKAFKKWGIGSLKHTKISQLSQGQQKRLSLSRCSWLKRSLWILDEPEAGLDEEGQIHLADTLSHHLEEGGTVVQAMHLLHSYHPSFLPTGEEKNEFDPFKSPYTPYTLGSKTQEILL